MLRHQQAGCWLQNFACFQWHFICYWWICIISFTKLHHTIWTKTSWNLATLPMLRLYCKIGNTKKPGENTINGNTQFIYIYIIDFGNIRYHATFYETQRSTTEWYSIIALQWRHNERDGVSSLTSLTIVCSTVYSGADQRKHQSSASLAFVRGIHRRPVNSLHKGPVTRKMFSFHDVIVGTFDIIPEVCDIRLSHKHII